jgi:tetratricopeptide (TPR) repeat protein/peroxiredoxin
MAGHRSEHYTFSRRNFFRKMRWASVLCLPAPIQALSFRSDSLKHGAAYNQSFPFADLRLSPHYPAKSPLEDLLRLVVPGTDEFVTEKYALEIEGLLDSWGQRLKSAPSALETLSTFLNASLEASLEVVSEDKPRSGEAIEVFRRRFGTNLVSGREPFLREMRAYLAPLSKIETVEFQITDIQQTVSSPLTLDVEIRYDLVGTRADAGREQRVGYWRTRWSRNETNQWRVRRWQATDETLSRVRDPVFLDVSVRVLGHIESYKEQLLYGVDHWRTVLDGACGIEVYGNNGIAAGDFDKDGFDDLYICQPAGLPNRLYHNRGDGTFEDVTETAGVGVLDATACALFADFRNKGIQDLLVVCGSGPLLFLNQGNGKFALKRDAFKFAQPSQGAFTHAAVADYDGDGLLDIYFCVYSYYLGLEQYQYPVPYFDARNGPPNFLFQNQGDGTFEDRTETAGLNVDNDRYSFACAWGNSGLNGRPDLYVANDFGRSNLYRNNGDGTFTSAAAQANVEDPGAGMSATWFDFDNDGKQDIYVANMWSAAGLRVSVQPKFHEKDPDVVRGYYREHARGNSLYRNLGNGRFENVSRRAGVDMGRWAWSSDAWDFDHDGYQDLYIANGYISRADTLATPGGDAGSFFWRQVVAKSPANSTPSVNYERGWNAINELIRSDSSWNGGERNVLYLNNRDGSFSEVSGVAGLDFPDDSRAFALADIDHDGRLEIILKNRTGPQLRVLRNAMKNLGSSIALSLRGEKSNRDAIGAAVTVDAAGHRQTKYLQAGCGFLSQHTKEVFFGLGNAQGTVHATIHWPSGLTQPFDQLPVNNRIEIHEGSQNFLAKPFDLASPLVTHTPASPQSPPTCCTSAETWLIQPLTAPEFSLTDSAGNSWNLQSLRGSPVLLHFWAAALPESIDQVRLLRQHYSIFAGSGLRILAINVDDPSDPAHVRAFAEKEKFSFPLLLATSEVVGVYNLFFRYLFDRRRDLPIPACFLLDMEGKVVKIYQGSIHPERIMQDLKSIPTTSADRIRKALPFPGMLYLGEFQRNDFTYGVAFFQRGYLQQAASSFKQVIATKPNSPEAYYNLGTLYLRMNALEEARRYLEQSLKLRSTYPEAWNNLGMIAAQGGHAEEAVRNFRESLRQRPDYTVALLNLGNLYRHEGTLDQAEKLLSRALQLEPENPEANYSIGMLYARQENFTQASRYLEEAVSLRPDYADALNNLGVLFVREQRYPEAEERFKTCIRVAQNFDQAYLNLARLYVLLKETEKAREVLQALLKEQPQHKLAQQALEMLD